MLLTSLLFCSDQDTGLEFDGLFDSGHPVVDTLVVVPHPERPVHDQRGGCGQAERWRNENDHRLSEMGRAGSKTGIFVYNRTGRRTVGRRFIDVVWHVWWRMGRRKSVVIHRRGTNERVRGAHSAIRWAGRHDERHVRISVIIRFVCWNVAEAAKH